MKVTLTLFFLIVSILVAGCDSQALIESENNKTMVDTQLSIQSNANSSGVVKVEIYHFHGTNQCASCIAVGVLAEETVNTYYADELKNGTIVFGHINGDLPENKELVLKYGATGSSLSIGTYTSDGQFKSEQNTLVWYKINNKLEYSIYLKGVIDKRLAGDFS